MNHPLTGAVFLPLVSLCALFVGYYWIYKRGEEKKDEPNRDFVGSVDQRGTTTKVSKNKKVVKKKKNHKCGCGSNEHASSPPSKIKILYGSLTGKSKVYFLLSFLFKFQKS